MASNQALLQVDAAGLIPDLVLLTFGHASPPPAIGTPEEQAAQIAEHAAVSVQPLVRLSMSPRRLRELANLISRALEYLEGSGGEQ